MDNLTEKKENVLLKIGSFCILIGGIVAGLIGIFNGAAVMLAMTVMDDETMRTLDEYAMQESDGLFGSGAVTGIANAVAIAVIVFAAILMIINIIVGAVGLSRCKKNAQKYTFFLGWGIALLVIGLFSLGQLFSLRGVFSAASGIVGPLLFIIGGIQENKAANAEQSGSL